MSRVATCCLALLTGGAACLVGQEAGGDTVPRPFVRGGVYDKPYLTRLAGRTAIGGYAEAHAVLDRVDGVTEEAGFVAKRFNLFSATQVSDFVRFGAELEFEDGAQEIALEYAAIDLRIHQAVALRAGMILSPLGRFNLAHDSPLNEFTERPLVGTEMLGVALSEPGLGAFGLFAVGENGRVTYEVYGVNGFHEGLLAEGGTRLPAGQANFEDNNASPAVVGRLAWSPRPTAEFGLSVHHGAYNAFNAEGLEVDGRRELTIWVVDWEGTAAGLRFSGEAARAVLEVAPGLRGVYAAEQRGLYVDVLRDFGRGWVRTMPGSYFSVGLRLDVVDFDADLAGDMIRQVTLGVNFRPTDDTVLKLGFSRGVARDRFNNAEDRAGLRFSVATYF